MLANEAPFALAIDPRQMDGALALDLADCLGHSQFWRDRIHHMHVIGHQMSLDDLAAFLRRKLTKHATQMSPQICIQGLASAFWNEDDMELAVPNRVT